MFQARTGRKRIRRPAARRRFEPRVEQLESRNLLSIFTPAQIRHAYGFDQIKFGTVAGTGAGQTIAIIDANDAPRIAADLQKFDTTFGLPAPPTFTKVNQTGGTALPSPDPDWATETSLDVEWAHAVAPGANILLVEANSASVDDLVTAVDYARQQPGVVAVSMSWGADEFSGENWYDGYFTTPAGHVGGSGRAGGVTFLASSGDSGAWYGPEWPSISPNVVAVGGTHLTLTAAGNYGGETGWNGSGGGYSWYEGEPGYQSRVQNSGWRTGPDVAYNADPNTGVYVYDSYPQTDGSFGWFQVGGTSAAAPQWAGLIAIADQGRALAGKGSLDGRNQTLPMLYAMPGSDFHDVTSGSNGYNAHSGYDLVTGRGSPVAPLVVQYLVTGSNTTSATVVKSSTKTTTHTATAVLEVDPTTPPDATGTAHGIEPGAAAPGVPVPISVLSRTPTASLPFASAISLIPANPAPVPTTEPVAVQPASERADVGHFVGVTVPSPEASDGIEVPGGPSADGPDPLPIGRDARNGMALPVQPNGPAGRWLRASDACFADGSRLGTLLESESRPAPVGESTAGTINPAAAAAVVAAVLAGSGRVPLSQDRPATRPLALPKKSLPIK